MKRRLAVLALATLGAILAATSGAMAGNPHFIKGGPHYSVSGNTVTASGSIAGLGHENIDVELVVVATADIECENPAGHVAPGQDKTFDTSSTVENLEAKNGRVNFTISTTASPTRADLAGSCPNPMWTPRVVSVDIESATLNVYQPSGSNNVVLTDTETF